MEEEEEERSKARWLTMRRRLPEEEEMEKRGRGDWEADEWKDFPTGATHPPDDHLLLLRRRPRLTVG